MKRLLHTRKLHVHDYTTTGAATSAMGRTTDCCEREHWVMTWWHRRTDSIDGVILPPVFFITPLKKCDPTIPRPHRVVQTTSFCFIIAVSKIGVKWYCTDIIYNISSFSILYCWATKRWSYPWTHHAANWSAVRLCSKTTLVANPLGKLDYRTSIRIEEQSCFVQQHCPWSLWFWRLFL